MARLWSCGFELGSATAGVEYTGNAVGGTPAGTVVVGAAYKRSGDYGCQCKIAGAGQWANINLLNFAAEQDFFFIRFYLYIKTTPNWTTGKTLINFLDDGYNKRVYAELNSDRTITLKDEDGTIGSSSALSAETWYRIEVMLDRTGAGGSHTVTMLVDTEEVSSSTRNLSIGCNRFWVGFVEGGSNATQGELWLDDIAFNDSTGTAQTGFPGEGKIVHLHPDTAGDINECSAGDYTSVSEVTPDDATSYAVFDANNDDLLVNCESATNAGIGEYDRITLVQVGYRHSAASAAELSFTPKLESQASGTLLSGTAFTHNDTTWKTNGDATPIFYKLTSYVDPQNAGPWTVTLLNTMQIGGTCTDAAPDMWLSTMWALVEYTTFASETNMMARIVDTWRPVSAIQIQIDGTWKEITKAQIQIDGTWESIF